MHADIAVVCTSGQLGIRDTLQLRHAGTLLISCRVRWVLVGTEHMHTVCGVRSCVDAASKFEQVHSKIYQGDMQVAALVWHCMVSMSMHGHLDMI